MALNYTAVVETATNTAPNEEPINELMRKLDEIVHDNADRASAVMNRMCGNVPQYERKTSINNFTEAIKELLNASVFTTDMLNELLVRIG